MMDSSRWLTIGLWAALVAAILTNWSARSWPDAVALGALCLVTVAWSIFGKQSRLPVETSAVCLVGAWGFLQLAFGASLVPFLTLRASLIWAGCAVAFVLGAVLLGERNERGRFLRLTMWTLTVLAVEAVLQYFISPQRVFGLFDGEPTVVGTMYYRNQFAALMEIGAGIALWHVAIGRPVIGALCFASMFGAVVATASRGGTIILVVELIVFLIVAGLRRTNLESSRLAVATLFLFAVAGAAVVGTENVWDRFQQEDMFGIRADLRASTVGMIRTAPLFGTGIGTWRSAYPRFATLDASAIANEAHNDWLQWFADGGVFFFLLMLFIAVRAGVPGVSQAWGLGLFAVMLHCFVDYQMRSPAVSFLWFTVAGAACARGASREKASLPL